MQYHQNCEKSQQAYLQDQQKGQEGMLPIKDHKKLTKSIRDNDKRFDSININLTCVMGSWIRTIKTRK